MHPYLTLQKIDDIMSDFEVKKLMFDDSFERSKLYFKVLQLLRIFSDEIQASVRDLESLDIEDTSNFGAGQFFLLRSSTADKKALQDNWETVMKYQTEAQDRLLKLIVDKVEEIKSLRDGVGSVLRSHTAGLILLAALQRDSLTGSVEVNYYKPICHRFHCCYSHISPSELYCSLSPFTLYSSISWIDQLMTVQIDRQFLAHNYSMQMKSLAL